MKHPLQVEFKVQSLVTSVWPVTPWHHQSPCKKIKANYCVLHWLLCGPWRLQSEMEQKIEDERQTQEEAAWLYPVRQAHIKVHQNDWEVTLTKNCLQGVSQACFEAPSNPVLEHVNPMQAAKVRKMELETDARQAWWPRGVTTVSHEARSKAPEHLSVLSNLSIFCWFQIPSVASTSSALHIPWHPWTPTAGCFEERERLIEEAERALRQRRKQVMLDPGTQSVRLALPYTWKRNGCWIGV